MVDLNYHGPVVAFDLDDTLFNEREFCRSGFRYLCNPGLYKVLTTDDYPSKTELDELAQRMDEALTARENPFLCFEELFKPLAEKHGLDWKLDVHIGAYRAHQPQHLPLREGVAEVLETLSSKGIRMALVTDGRSTTQRRKIEALGIEKYFAPELILISEETGSPKTESKKMFSSIVGVFPEAGHFYYIGNNPLKDFYYPNLLGWTTMQVPPDPDDVHPPVTAPSPLHEAKVKLPSFKSILKQNYINEYHA